MLTRTETKTPSKVGKGLAWLLAHANYAGDDCLPWPYSRTNGYGMFSYQAKLQYAHRYMCELAHGAPPTPKHYATHSCGNGHLGCTNPRHLSWKTSSENNLDRHMHGTMCNAGSRGKLSREEKIAIKVLEGKLTQGEIAKLLGVSRSAVSNTLYRKAWTKAHGVRQTKAGWRARVQAKGVVQELGIFSSRAEAMAAYDAASNKLRPPRIPRRLTSPDPARETKP